MGRGPVGQQVFPPHGTIQGYRAHFKWGPLPPCEECREANRQKSRAYRAKMIDCPDCGRRMKLGWRYRCDWCAKKLLKSGARRKKRGGTTPVAIQGDVVVDGPAALPDPGAAQQDVPGSA